MNPNDPLNQVPQNPNGYEQQPNEAFAPNVGVPQPGQSFAPNAQPGTVPPQPAMYAQPTMPMQPQQPTPFANGMPTMMQAAPTKRGHKGLIIVLLVIIIAAAVGAYFLTKKSSPNSSNGTTGSSGTSSSQLASQLQLLTSKGSKLQSGDLSKLNKTTLFYAVFKNAAEQNVVGITSDHYEGGSPTDQTSRAYEFLHQTTFNYKTKALAAETQSTTNDYDERCVNGKNYTYDYVSTWQPNTDTTASCTDPNDYNNDIGDGFDTGGLTAAQAQTFVDGITNFSGLISVDSMSYATHDNAPYIRLAVTVHPIATSSDLGNLGMGLLETAFDKTGLNSSTWPFQTTGTLATGAKIIYYVNPATGLPAYSQIGLTYYLNDSGQQVANNIYDFQDSEYSFGGNVEPLPLTGAPAAIKLSWNEESM